MDVCVVVIAEYAVTVCVGIRVCCPLRRAGPGEEECLEEPIQALHCKNLVMRKISKCIVVAICVRIRVMSAAVCPTKM